MNKRTRFLLGIGVIAALVIGFQVAAYAVHDIGVFELDGNATDDPTVEGDDWNTATKTFVPEPNLNASIFTGGGSKDPQNINKWAWKDGAGGLPDKDNLLDAFATRYTDEATDDELLYFGADRYDNSGDALMGFWFLQDEVDDNGTNSIGGGTGFTGVHTNGDLLVVSNFSNGGGTSTITVYEWNTACTKAGVKVDPDGAGPLPALTCGDANLLILASSEDALCAEDLVGDDFCGIVNPNTIPMPWSFTDKSGTTVPDGDDPGTAPDPAALNGEFFEGGINLSALGLDDECFATFAVETRSSTSTTATLKDFILGDFESCAAGMTTQASNTGTVTPGTDITDTATIKVEGATNPADPTSPPNVEFFLCGPGQLNAVDPDDPAVSDDPFGCVANANDPDTVVGTSKPLQGGASTTDGTATATSDAVNTQTSKLGPGFYCFRAEWDGDANYPTDLSHTNITTECFTVAETSAISTAQNWLPNDTASVTLGSGGTPNGTVTFKLYDNGTCDTTDPADLLGTFTDNTAPYASNNTTVETTAKTVSWLATFAGATGSNQPPATGVCETMTVSTIDNDGP